MKTLRRMLKEDPVRTLAFLGLVVVFFLFVNGPFAIVFAFFGWKFLSDHSFALKEESNNEAEEFSANPHYPTWADFRADFQYIDYEAARYRKSLESNLIDN